MGQPFLTDPRFLVRLMCHLALLGLAPHLHLPSRTGQQFLWDPRFLMALWVLGRHWLRRFRKVRRYLVRPMFRLVLWLRWVRGRRMLRLSLTDRRLHLDLLFPVRLMFRLARLGLVPRWLRLSLTGQPLQWGLMFHLGLLLLMPLLCRTALPSHLALQSLVPPMCRLVLSVLGHHLDPLLRKDRLLRGDLMCRKALWVLGLRWLRRFRKVRLSYGAT